MKKLLLMILFLTALLIFGGCSAGQQPGSAAASDIPQADTTSTATGATGAASAGVTLTVTAGFGTETLFQGNSPLEKEQSVMDILEKNVTVESAYGGSFVNSINGLVSGRSEDAGAAKVRKDWFYYVNGIMGSSGANDYLLQEGDAVWWDYHYWNDQSSFSPAVIGSYPQPFVSGFGGENPGTLILAEKSFMEQGEALADSLRQAGAAQVRVEEYDEKKLTAAKEMVIVIAAWSALGQQEFWLGVQENRDKTGLFLKLTDSTFTSYDGIGREIASYGAGTGAIFATASGMGDSSPIWVVTGTDSAGTAAALELLLDSPPKISAKLSCIIDQAGEIIGLPINNQ